jgi:hypothetical protein
MDAFQAHVYECKTEPVRPVKEREGDQHKAKHAGQRMGEQGLHLGKLQSIARQESQRPGDAGDKYQHGDQEGSNHTTCGE